MDFSKPVKAPGTRACPPDIELPGVEDAGGGAGSDFFVWRNTLGPSDSSAPSCPNPMDITNPGLAIGTSLAAQLHWPMSVQAPGIDTSLSLPARLHWRVRGETDHQQVEIRIGKSVISVDREWADFQIFELLDAALISCCTSCIGTGNTWAYVMFIGANSAQRFLQIWHRYLTPLGYPMPALDFTARDAEWRAEVLADYACPRPPPVDEEGLTFTARWREHRENMIEILPKLAWALRCHLRRSAEQ